jgi:hypothetical protein
MAQWLKGIALAETEWIYIAESDDTCHPQLFESLFPALNKPDVVLALTEVQYINQADEVILRFPPLGKGQWNGADFVRRHMLHNCYLCNSGMALFRKQAAPAPGVWQQELRYSPDYYFWIRLMLRGKVYNNGEVMANFRKHPEEFTHGKWDSLTEHNDHAQMLYMLYEEGLQNPNDIKQTIYFKLTGLATRRRGMAHADYLAYRKCWLQLARLCRLQIHPPVVELKSYLRKLRHRLG